MTPERIAELRALAEAATPGPWAYFDTGDKGGPGWVLGTIYDTREKDMVWHTGRVEPDIYNEETTEFVQVADIMDRIAHDSDDGHARIQDAAFIAAARTALPEALDAVERVRALALAWPPKARDFHTAIRFLNALEGAKDMIQGPMTPREMQNVEDQVVARYFPTLDDDGNEEQRIVYCLPDLGPSDPVARAAMLDYAKHFGDSCKCGHEKGLHHWVKLQTSYCRVAVCQCEEFEERLMP